MRRSTHVLAFGMLVGLLLFPGTAGAQEQRRGYSAILDNTDVLVENYANFLARKYDLNAEQDAFTRQLLREKANQFLGQHENDLRGLVDRLFEVRTGAEMPQEELIDWGKKAAPLFNDAKKIIVEGNDQWRQVLTEEQKKIHDEDLALMHESFQTTEDQLTRIVTGQMTVEEFRNPPRNKTRNERAAAREVPNARRFREQQEQQGIEQPGAQQDGPVVDAQPLPADSAPGASGAPATASGERPRRASPAERTRRSQPPPTRTGDDAGQGGQVVERGGDAAPAVPDSPGRRDRRTGRARAAVAGKDFESQWEAYVRDFIQRFQLNEAQSQRAQSILKDCQEQGQRVMKSRQAQLERIDKRETELRESKDKEMSKQLAELGKERTKLLEPINDIFEKQLKPRLESLPTRAQRAAAETAAKKPGANKPERAGKPAEPVPPPPPPQPEQAEGETGGSGGD